MSLSAFSYKLNLVFFSAFYDFNFFMLMENKEVKNALAMIMLLKLILESV